MSAERSDSATSVLGIAVVIASILVGVALGRVWGDRVHRSVSISCEVVEVVKEKRRVLRKRAGQARKKEDWSPW